MVMMVMITSAVAVSKESETRVRPTVSTGGMLAVATPARVIATTHVKMLGNDDASNDDANDGPGMMTALDTATPAAMKTVEDKISTPVAMTVIAKVLVELLMICTNSLSRCAFSSKCVGSREDKRMMSPP